LNLNEHATVVALGHRVSKHNTLC